MQSKKRILSGIQSTGKPHLGNYFGSMKSCIDLQSQNDSFVFIADLHSLTTFKTASQLTDNIRDTALDYLALGLDPEQCVFFRQSDVPEHCELSWIFSAFTAYGVMERAHAWKDALVKKKKDPTVGLFTYPILMAADILLYQPHLVPVGKDQKQHVEIARDIAEKFNSHFGEIFTLPQEYTPEGIATIFGTDGEKMSKSYGNTIDIFATEEQLKKQVMSIKTDSTALEEPKNPDTCNVFRIYTYLADNQEIANLRDRYLAGNFGYGEAKKILLAKIQQYFAPALAKRIELAAKKDYLEDVLASGAKKAKKVAKQTLDTVKEKIGLIL